MERAGDYARWLETQPWVSSYEASFPLDSDIIARISRAGIRADYLQTVWTTDFVLRRADGHKGVRELIQRQQLKKKAYLEHLELSRRYWTATDTEWMVVIVDGYIDTSVIYPQIKQKYIDDLQFSPRRRLSERG